MKWIKKMAGSMVIAGLLLCLCAAVPAAAKPRLNKTSLTLIKGQKATLTVRGNTSAKVKWSTADKTVAVVSRTGVVKAKAKGKTTVSAKVGTKTLNCRVKVEAPVLSVSSAEMGVGTTLQLKVKGTKQKVTWKSRKPKIAAVDATGLVTAKKTGKAVITATVLGKTYKAQITVVKLELSDLFGITEAKLLKMLPGLEETEGGESGGDRVTYTDGYAEITVDKDRDSSQTAKTAKTFSIVKKGRYTIYGCDLGMTQEACLKSVREDFSIEPDLVQEWMIRIGKPNGEKGMTVMEFQDGKMNRARMSDMWAE